jgi:hypothetical protein
VKKRKQRDNRVTRKAGWPKAKARASKPDKRRVISPAKLPVKASNQANNPASSRRMHKGRGTSPGRLQDRGRNPASSLVRGSSLDSRDNSPAKEVSGAKVSSPVRWLKVRDRSRSRDNSQGSHPDRAASLPASHRVNLRNLSSVVSRQLPIVRLTKMVAAVETRRVVPAAEVMMEVPSSSIKEPRW